MLPLVRKTLAAMSGWLPAFYGARFQIKVDEDNVPALAEEREALVAADQRRRVPERRREAAAARAAEVPGGVMRGTGVRGGGSRFLYEPFERRRRASR